MRFPRARRWASLSFAIAAASALVLASSVARADGEDRDGDLVPDDLEDLTERNVVWDLVPKSAPRSIAVSSKSVGAPEDDRFLLDYEEGTFELTYFREDAGGSTNEFTLSFETIFEWTDENGDDRLSESEIGQNWSLGSSSFQNATIEHLDASNADGGRISAFLIRAWWGPASQATLVLTVSQRFLRLGEGRILTPMEAKLDFHLNHTFVRLGAQVGIELHIETDESATMTHEPTSWDAERGFSEDESWVNLTRGSPSSTVFFSWANHASADDVAAPIATLVTPEYADSESLYKILLGYPPGQNPAHVRVVHDPTLGVVSEAYASILNLPPPPRLQGDVVLYGLSIAGATAFVAGTVLLASRRRRQD